MAAVTITVEANFSGSTWTDITAYLESEIQISGGRQDELSQADANQCSFTLDNRDGRFTPGKTTGAYYPNVKVGVPIRVTAGIDTATSRRFTGFVDSWQLTWDDDVPRVQVSATSIMARLGLLSERKSAIEEEILVDGPAVYYPLSEPAGSASASDRSGNGNYPLISHGDGPTPVFGSATGPSADGLTAAQFVGSGAFFATTDAVTASLRTLEAFVAISLGGGGFLGTWYPIAIGGGGYLRVLSTGDLQASLGGVLASASGTSVANGNTHHIAATLDGSGLLTVYLDGVSVATASGGGAVASGYVYIGQNISGTNFTGTVAHAAGYTTAVAGTRLAGRYTAGMTGFNGETTAARLARYATWGKVTAYSATSATPVASDEYDGASLVDLLHNLETTDNGVLYDERDGTLTLKSRQARYSATVAATFDATAQQLESSFTPTTDRQGLANDVTVTAVGGLVANVVDTASQTAYGVARTSIDTLATDAQDPLARAQWEVAAHATPKERVPSLGVDVLNCGLAPATLLGLTVGSRVAVTNPPSQAAGPGDYFIEGWSETFDPTSYMATFNVSPAQPWVNTFVLEDPTRGVLDSTFVLAY